MIARRKRFVAELERQGICFTPRYHIRIRYEGNRLCKYLVRDPKVGFPPKGVVALLRADSMASQRFDPELQDKILIRCPLLGPVRGCGMCAFFDEFWYLHGRSPPCTYRRTRATWRRGKTDFENQAATNVKKLHETRGD